LYTVTHVVETIKETLCLFRDMIKIPGKQMLNYLSIPFTRTLSYTEYIKWWNLHFFQLLCRSFIPCIRPNKGTYRVTV